MRFYLLHKNVIDLLANLFKVWAAVSSNGGHDLIIGEAHLLNHAHKGRNRLFLGMLSGDTCVSIPSFLLLCLVIGLVTVHTCELTKVSLSRPTA